MGRFVTVTVRDAWSQAAGASAFDVATDVRVGAAIRLDRVCMSVHGADHFDISPFHRAFRRTRSEPLQLADHIAVGDFLRTASRHVRVGGELRDHTQVVSAHVTSMLNIASMTPCLYEGIDRYLRLIDATRNSL